MTDPLLEAFDPFVYRADVTHVVDGDTFDVVIDMGFNTNHEVRIRPLDIDTAELPPELHFPTIDRADLSEERREKFSDALEQKDFLIDWVDEAQREHDGEWPFVIDTERDRTGKYGRYLAYLYRKSDGEELTAAILEKYGDGVRYD